MTARQRDCFEDEPDESHHRILRLSSPPLQVPMSQKTPVTVEHARKGLHVRGSRGNPVVRRALIRFARWLRTEYEFPVRVPVYLFRSDHIVTMHGERVSASFFAPCHCDVEPCIRIATGDYDLLQREHGRDNALAAHLASLAHEVIHYQQWLATGETHERGVATKARGIVDRYAKSVCRP